MTTTTTGTVPVMSAGWFLRAAREQRGITQNELAQILGIDRSTVREAEAGIRKPKHERVVAWATACDVPVAWLQFHVDLAGEAGIQMDLEPVADTLRACRDSNPKPSDLYPVAGSAWAGAVKATLTTDRRVRSAWELAA